MILADVLPVFCPRVIVPPPTPWPRALDHAETGLGKMWNNHNGRHLSDEDFRRAFPNLRLPLPEKSFVVGEANFRGLAYSESPFKSRSTPLITDPFKGFPQQSTILKAPSFAGHQSSRRESVGPGLTMYINRSPFKPPATVTELQLKSYERELEMRETKLRFSPEKRFCPSLPSQSHDVCDRKTLKLYRKQSSNAGQSKKLYTCPQCKYVTDRKNNLKRHISTMHQDCSKVLDCCGMVFRSKALLRDHVSLFHRAGYRCQYCGRNFCRKALLRRHLTVHSGQKDFTCAQCGYATSHKSNLERHRKIHDRKYSMGGEVVSEDNDSNEVSACGNYCGEMSSNSSSAESSATESPTKSSSGFTEEMSTLSPGLSPFGHVRGVPTGTLLATRGNGQHYGIPANQPQIPTELQNDAHISTSAAFERVSSLRNLSSSGIAHQISEFFAIPTFLKYEPREIEYKVDKQRSSPAKIKEGTSNKDSKSKSCEQIRSKSASSRLFLTPYKCCDCLAVFSRQQDFDKHSCKPTKHITSSPPISVMERKSKKMLKQTFVSPNCNSIMLSSSENCEKPKIRNIPVTVNIGQSWVEDSASAGYISNEFPLRERDDQSEMKSDTSLPIKKRTIDDRINI